MGNENVTTFDQEKDFEDAVIALLKNCGWEKEELSYPTEEALIKNWADILFNNNRDIDRLGDYPLTDGEMKQILEQVANLRTPFALNGFINGKTVSVKRDNPDDRRHFGKEVSLHIYDRNEIAGGKSRYQIVRQPKFKAAKNIFPSRRGDLMLLINGMPVFHIELKRSGIPISKAWNQIEKYSKENIFSGIFSLVQIFVAMMPSDAVYFTNPGPEGRFNPDFYFRWANFDNLPITDWAQFTQSLLYIPMAHQLIGFYTVADGRDGILKVLRSYQYYAVSAITNKVAQRIWDEKKQRGGYIWHTTGSGKTLTSFKAADLISKTQDADKVVFLVDRKELDTQSLENYKLFADDKDDVQETGSTDELAAKLMDHAPSSTLIVTSIQKMSRIMDDRSRKRQKDIETINRKRLVFIVDECHRDTFGDMMRAVKDAFPYAMFFGFTGTPIQEENKKKGCTSSDVFGDELHRYTIGDGIRDENVLAFDLYRIGTFDDYDVRKCIALEKAHAATEEEALADDRKRRIYYKYMNDVPMAGHLDRRGKYVYGIEDHLPATQYTTDKHIETVIAHILKIYENISRGRKFHSIFATSSIPEALEYYRRFKKVSTLKVTVLVDPSDNNTETSYEKMQGLAEVISDYNERYRQAYSIPSYGRMKKDIALRLAHDKAYKGIERRPAEQLDMLIVVNQMLTGFDSKWVNVLYLDKLMQQENIIQAFSRTNRIFSKDEKPAGLIYYFRYPHTMARNIEEAVKLYSGNKAYMVFVDKLEKNLEKLNAIYLDIKELFENEGISDFSHLPQEPAVKARFAKLFNDLNALLAMVKVQDFSWSKSVYGTITVLLTEEIYCILLQRYKDLFEDRPGGAGDEDPPYDLDPHITEIRTGKIDADYINSRFEKYIKIRLDGRSKETIENALRELFKSFAMLSEEEQKFAEIFIKDVQLGNVVPEAGKTFKDYVAEYMRRAKDDQIHRFSQLFGVNEGMLRAMIELRLTEENINEFGRFDQLKASFALDQARAYFEGKENEKLSDFKVRARFSNLLRSFLIQGGFDL